ncbi:outer membrane protein assembly factor BamB [Psychrosphaera haliotis]|uniref:Outer membrane protein assembly factor BamB n=1 Tax=Psychrosphaera haliotis TaxID=555083 RepID=A0A6N8FDF0_9GAMM|nr:outer membrane protein assembly factor BamB [Psychrosphaera haliotis]MUH72361.1 outer membrane protein assembly factor BamB [Psychrosphaera haliotis]
MLFNNMKSSVIKLAFLTTLSTSMLMGCETTEENEATRIAELKSINITRDVEVEWRKQAGSGVENYFSNLQPAVVGDVIFAASRKGEVLAYNKLTGKMIWETDTRSNPPSFYDKLTFGDRETDKLSGGITAAYKNIYIGSENGEVIALSQESGELLWRQKVDGEVVAAPDAGDGWVAVSTTSGNVVVLHPDSGEMRWQAETTVPALTLRGTSSPTIESGGVLVGTATGKLQVMLLDQGLLAWDAQIAVVKGTTELERLIDVDSKPIVVGPDAYMIAYNGNLAAVDIQSGRVKWKREYSSYRNLTLDTGIIYLTDAKGFVTAVEASTGVEKWTNNDFYNRRLSQPVVYKDTIVVGDFEGYYHFLDKNSGVEISRYKLDDWDYSAFRWFVSWFTSEDRRAYASPVASEELLYIQTRDGELTALRLP